MTELREMVCACVVTWHFVPHNQNSVLYDDLLILGSKTNEIKNKRKRCFVQLSKLQLSTIQQVIYDLRASFPSPI